MLVQRTPTPGFRFVTSALMLVAVLTAVTPRAADAASTGEQIYRKTCVACHGASGEGSRDYPRVLAGDRSVAQLARLIEKTMPEDDPGTCVGEDAQKVAAYIYEAFYSKAAQLRNQPPRVALSRLTVRQYQNTVSDLIGSFRGPSSWGSQRGLRGQYFNGRRNRERLIDRVDPVVQFDFGTDGPDPDKFDATQFSIRWEGSLLAPESGEYEFIVHTEHAVRLFVNDPRTPLIDAFVKSGNDTEYRGSIRLLGGRVYPIRLEFSKAKQGVDDSKTNKKQPPPVKASIALEWKLPKRTAEIIPERNLSPAGASESFVLSAPFPPDDRSVGYERGTSISKAWDQATTEAAFEVVGYVAGHLRELSGASGDSTDRAPKLRDFCARFAERAFRRPLTDEQKQFFIDRQFKEARDLDTAVKRSVLLVLKSPRFLYREVGSSRDPYDVAARLSFSLWDSLPDNTLLEAAAAGRLATREQVTQQAERMVGDLRTRAKLREFFLQWLRVEQNPELSKDPKQYPDFSEAVVSDLRTSLDLFLEEVLWTGNSDFRQLLLADYLYLNGRLAKRYGIDMAPDSPFRKVKLEPQARAGVLTHPYLLASFAYTAASSPIHRGVFVSRSVLGRSLRPPPEAVAPLAPELHASLTTRERVLLQTSPKACTACHGMINPLGFGLEHFDAIGRYRSEEKGKPIDAKGSYEARTGDTITFTGARDLAKLLATSDETETAVVEQLFHYMIKQPIRAFGPRESSELRRSFAGSGYNVRTLLVAIVSRTALPEAKKTP